MNGKKKKEKEKYQIPKYNLVESGKHMGAEEGNG